MKQTMLVVIASAMIGGATAVFFTQGSPTPVRSSAPARSIDAAAIEMAFVRALESMGFSREAHAQPPSRPDVSQSPPSREEGTMETTGPQGRAVLPVANLPVLSSLTPFDKDERLRRTWLFSSEREVIDWLGTPNEVQASGGTERWLYNIPVGVKVILVLHRGRLLNMYRSSPPRTPR